MYDPAKKGKVLIVDDDEIIRMSLQDMLEMHDIPSMTASDGIEALEVFSSHGDTIKLIILDLNMPGLNGHETFLKLKEMNESVPVLLATGDISSKKIDAMRAKGLEYVLEKPVKFEKIKNILYNLQ
ncbi:MAG: response regulator [Spirochaetales bacterium]|nr:response regulator [Spirochaetales bacterium]